MSRGVLVRWLTAAAIVTAVSQQLVPAAEAPPPGTLLTVAGTGKSGSSGDGGPALEARFTSLHAVAFDPAGRLYVLDSGHNVVRRIDRDGVISTVVGTGREGFAGDNGPATEARLNFPLDIAVDGAGNLYINDFGNNRVRIVTPDGIITTLAGPGKRGDLGDNGPAAAAYVSGPLGLAIDAADNVYFSEFGSDAHRIRKVRPDGIITTVAGTGRAGFSEDGGPATEARINTPIFLDADAEGNLYFADANNRRVRKVDRNGTITTVIGGGRKSATEAEGGPALEISLPFAHSVVVDSQGNLFLSDACLHRVFKVTPDGMITTVVGSGPQGTATRDYTGEGGPATTARLVGPVDIALGPDGDLFVAEGGAEPCGRANNERVLKVFGVAAPGLIAGRAFPEQP